MPEPEPGVRVATGRYECCPHCDIAGQCGSDRIHPFPCEMPGCVGQQKKKRP